MKIKTEVFHIATTTGPALVYGIRVYLIKGIVTYAHYNSLGVWSVSEKRSGRSLVSGAKSMEEATEAAKALIEEKGRDATIEAIMKQPRLIIP